MSAVVPAKEAQVRKGDTVRIINPQVFVRCGYPLDPAEVNKRMASEYGKRIRDFLNLDGHKTYADLSDDLDSLFTVTDESWLSTRAFILAARALASQFLESKGFGGRLRTIHTAETPELKGQTYKVAGWHFNKTGEYFPPNHWPGSWDSPAEYEPGGLDKVKTHRILHLENFGRSFGNIQIEDCHVESVEQEAA